MCYTYFRQAAGSVLIAVALFSLSGVVSAYGQGSYQGHADGSLTIDTSAGGNFSYSTLQGQTNQSSLHVGNSNVSASANTMAAGTMAKGSADVSGNTVSAPSFAASSATTTGTGFSLVNNTGSPFVVTFDWTGDITGNITANLSNTLSKVSGSFELCFLPAGGQVMTLATINQSLSKMPNASFAQSSSGQSSVTIPEGASSLYYNLDPDGASMTTPEPASVLLLCAGGLGPLCYVALQRRKQRA